MSETCAFIERIASWVYKLPVPPILYCGRAGHGFGNKPAPQIEICYLLTGHYDDMHVGDLNVTLPSNHVSIHNLHHGNYSDVQKRSQSWCLFLDVEKVQEFSELYETPIFNLIEIEKPDELIRAFQLLTLRCNQAEWSSPIYPGSKSYVDARNPENFSLMDRLAINSALIELLLLLYREARRKTTPADAHIPDTIREAMEFIELHYCEPETNVNVIAKSVHLSPDHFTRLFKKHVGESPMHYLRHIRVSRSKSLLRDSDQQIQSICWNVGFKDPFHFSKVFREFTGLSPSKYRKAKLQEESD